MFYIQHRDSGRLADKNCTGEHDVEPVDNCSDAKSFATLAEASDFEQNFGPDWWIGEY